MNSESGTPQSSSQAQPARPRGEAATPNYAETVPFHAASLSSQAGKPTTKPSGAGGRGKTLPGEFGRFRIERQLGQGGMGAVFLAHDTQLNRPVALKVPSLDDDGTGTVVARFLREARAVASLSHPNICQIYDVGQLEDTHYIAMAYIDGRPLTEFIDAAKPQPQRHVAMLIRKVALALHEAHQQNILHRDLKPANIMVNRRGEPIVMDFGLACRVAESAQSRLTHEGHLIGTPAYMSPEQINDRAALGPATDIYSLGVVMYELLAGRAAFSGSVVSVIAKVLNDEPPQLCELRSDIDPQLAEICARAMAKSPAARFGSMKDLAAALTAYLKGASATATKTALAPLPDLSEIDALAQVPTASSQGLLQPAFAVQRTSTAWPPAMKWALAAGVSAVVILLAVIVARAIVGGTSDEIVVAAGSSQMSESPANAQAKSAVPAPPASNSTIAAPGSVTPEPVAPPADLRPEPPPQEPATQPDVAPPTAAVEQSSESRTDKPLEQTQPIEQPVVPQPQPELPPASVSDLAPPATTTDDLQKEPTAIRNAALAALEERFTTADRNRDGRLDRSEAELHIIHRADKNDDEVLELSELRAAFGRLGQKLFAPPTSRELKKLPQPPPNGPFNRPPPPR